ncbi:hypothetical protein DRQ25_05250 [Candidatus Fermentibacteria bacterium]|nr:MAG: hypothetical protein DRQ25_05250 [Candidatus Fermentibacteria bacterium]
MTRDNKRQLLGVMAAIVNAGDGIEVGIKLGRAGGPRLSAYESVVRASRLLTAVDKHIEEHPSEPRRGHTTDM